MKTGLSVMAWLLMLCLYVHARVVHLRKPHLQEITQNHRSLLAAGKKPKTWRDDEYWCFWKGKDVAWAARSRLRRETCCSHVTNQKTSFPLASDL